MGPTGKAGRNLSSIIPQREDAFSEGVRQKPQGNPAEKALGGKLLDFMYGKAVQTLRSPGMNNTSHPRNTDLPTENEAKRNHRPNYAADSGNDAGSFVSVHVAGYQGKTPTEEGVEVTLYGKRPANEPEQNLSAKMTVRDGKPFVQLERLGPEGTLVAQLDGNEVKWKKVTYSNGMTGMATTTPISEAEARQFMGKFQPTAGGSKGELLLEQFDSPQLQNALRVMTEGRAPQRAWSGAKTTGSWA